MRRFKVIKSHRPREIAPRLANGESRLPFGHGLPEGIKDGIRAIAERENRSMSWVMERVIIDYFRLERPEYRERKKPIEAEEAAEVFKRKRRGVL